MTRTQQKTLAVGFGLILAAGMVIALIWAGSYLPGLAGEIFSKIAGIMWTPVLLDLTIFFLGLSLVLWINAWIRAREGEELVYLEQIEGPAIPSDLPEQARSAVYREEPAPCGDNPVLAAIEGALDLPDPLQAAELLYQLPPEELDTPEVLALRIRLARLNERPDQAAELERLLAEAPEPPGSGESTRPAG